ncbi:hypothetical protein MMC10_004982 [Thelotrema lepadinum]|nr:hypothetical protein [Thelotrema lepadinum]
MAICVLSWNGDRKYTSLLYSFLKQDQATVQVAVQVVAHILAALQVASLCTTFNLSTRYRIPKHAIALRSLSFWTAISRAHVDLSLPWPYMLATLAFMATTLLPGALWAGALSPLFVLESKELGHQILPVYSDSTNPIWNSQFKIHGPHIKNILDNCTLVDDADGLIPTCPVPALQGPLLLSGSSATTLNGSLRNHSKLDNPNWQYKGRSFGVGSSVGLKQDGVFDDRVLNYTYVEHGYATNVLCTKNSTADFRLELLDSINYRINADDYQTKYHPELPLTSSLTIPLDLAVYIAHGYLPNSVMGAPEHHPVVAWKSDYENITTWAAVAKENRYMIAVATGSRQYQQLNQTQCEVFFTPTKFNVAVDRMQQSITVQPLQSARVDDIDESQHLQANVVHSLNLLSRMSPSLYVSVLGEMLSRNTEWMQKQNPDLNSTEAVTLGVAASFTAMIDDILVAYGSSQISNAHDTTETPASGVVEAVQIGQSLYRYLVFVLNSLLIFIVSFEAARTGCWAGLTKFNYLDVKSVVIASSAAGPGTARGVMTSHRLRGTRWVADPLDRIASAARVKWDLGAVMEELEIVDLDGGRKGEGREKRA